MLTKDGVLQLDETNLRRVVLIPLFRAMGYLDVTEYHGSSEQGKDIVMWHRDPLRGRVNYAVVVKATPISGRASGGGSAAEVAAQVRQCFNAPFKNPRKPGDEKVHQCIVVTPHDLKIPTLETLTSLLLDLERNVMYLCGHELFEAIDEHLGARTLIPRLSELGVELAALSSEYSVSASIVGGALGLVVTPKAATSTLLRGTLAFSSDAEGQLAQEGFLRHMRTGEPVVIDGRYLIDLEVPDVLAKLGLTTPKTLELTPLESSPVLLDLIFAGPLETLTLRDVPFRARGGTEVLTLSSEAPGGAWKITLEAKRGAPAAHGQLSTLEGNRSVKRLLEATRLQLAWASGGHLTICESNTGRRLGDAHFSPNTNAAPDERWVSFLKTLSAIESTAGVTLELPDRELLPDEFRHIRHVADALTVGTVSGRAVNDLAMTLTRPGVVRFLEELEKAEHLTLWTVTEDTADVLGVTVPLGRVVREVRVAKYTAAELARLRDLVDDGSNEDIALMVRLADQPGNVVEKYLKWLPAEESEEWQRRFPETPSVKQP